MSVTQYIGARYVPLFADPAEWSNNRTYEPLTIVLHQGNSYTSRQFVPRGIQITDARFWAETGNYSAQVEQYRQEVLAVDGRIAGVEDSVTAETTRATAAEKANADAISAETTRATAAEKANADAISANVDAISAETTRATTAEQANADAISAEVTRATAEDQTLNAAVDRIDDDIDSVNDKVSAILGTKLRKIDDFIGLSVHELTNAHAKTYAEYDFQKIRIDLTWSEIERTANVYNFDAYDLIAQNARNNNLKILFILDYNNSLYASSASNKISGETNMNAFKNFVTNAVTHFSDYDCDWEIWNEPNHAGKPEADRYTPQEYFTLVQNVYGVIKSTDPNANVLIGAIGDDGETSANWWFECCKLGVLNYCDKTSLHFYVTDAPENFVYTEIMRYQSINANFSKKSIPWVITEIGYNTEQTSGNNPTDAQRSSWLTREMLLLLDMDIDSVYIYEGMSTYVSTNPEAYFGLFDSSLHPTATATAFKTINTMIANALYAGTLTAPDDTYYMAFYKDELFYISWNKNSYTVPQKKLDADSAYPMVTQRQMIAYNYLRCGTRNPGTHSESFNDFSNATGWYSHAEGNRTTASGAASHSEGDYCVASGGQAHAEGFHTTASGGYSHAGGTGCEATQGGAFAHGENCIAKNFAAVALGYHTKTLRDHQLVCGSYNIETNSSPFVVGVGTDDDNRANGFEVLEHGIIVRGDDNYPYKLHISNGSLVIDRLG